MTIRKVEVINLHFAYRPDRRFRYARGICTGRLTSLIKVYTDEDLVGLGSVYSHPDLVRTIVEGHLAPTLVGRDPLKVDEIWTLCYGLTHWYGRKGVAVSALGGVDMALWDIRGKALNRRVCDLLRGTRDHVPAYASGLLWKDDTAQLRDEALRHLDGGFRAMKMRLGRNREYDVSGLQAVREAVGSDVRVMVDGNAKYSLDEALWMTGLFEEMGVHWLEEPFPPEQPEKFRVLHEAMPNIPLAAGENEFGAQGFNELLHGEVVQVVQPDCCRCGGLTEARRVCTAASKLGARIAPHTWSDSVALTANLHLVSSAPAGLFVEVDQTGNPFIDELLADGPRIEGGIAYLPEHPGLGIELDEDVVERHTIPRGDPIPPGNYSDMIFR